MGVVFAPDDGCRLAGNQSPKGIFTIYERFREDCDSCVAQLRLAHLLLKRLANASGYIEALVAGSVADKGSDKE